MLIPANRLKGLCALVLALLGAAGWAQTQNSGSAKALAIDALVSHYQQRGYLNGTVLVALHGRPLYVRGVGYANIEARLPNTAQTKFGIASITKQFTAALVRQQVVEGKLRLEASVVDYLPWYRKDTGARMTIEQLLHHTSGLPADYNLPEFCDTPQARQHYSPEEFARKFCQPDLVSEPGAKWAYSNCGYVLLGLILERVTGKSFGDLLSERILTPLGMKDTGMDHNDLAAKGGALGYTRHAGARYTPGAYIDRDHIFSAGSMYSTVEDLLRWNQALSTNGLFSEAFRNQLFTPAMANWADGWFVTRIPQGRPGAGNPQAEMRGDMTGNFFAWVIRYPQQDAVIIVLRNGYGSTEHFEENLQAILFDQPPRLPPRALKDVLVGGRWLFLSGAAVLVAAAWFIRRPRKSQFHVGTT